VAVARPYPSRSHQYAWHLRGFGTASVLGALLAVSVTLAIDAASGPTEVLRWTQAGRPYPGWLAGPFEGLGRPLSLEQFFFDLVLMFVLWAIVCQAGEAVRLSWAIAAIVLAHLIFLLAPPIGLSDAFNYIGYGRAAVQHGLNPYTAHLQAIAHDPAFPYVTWPLWTNPYGPLSTLAFYPLGLLSVPQALWSVKLAVTVASLGCVALVGLCARELGRPPVPAMVFFGLNPLLLVYAVGGGHNDVFIMLFGLAGILAMLRSREQLAGAALAGAAAVKLTGGLLLPFALIAARRPRDVMAGAGAAAFAVFGFGLVLWGPHLLAGLEAQREVGSLRSIPGLYGSILFGATGVTSAMVWIGTAVLVGAVAFLLWRVRHGEHWIESAGWATLTLLMALTWLMPWYLVWLLPLAALSDSRRLRYATIGLGLLAIFLRAPTPLSS
jgi:hypothetical protein